MKIDPATMREAARQLREEADSLKGHFEEDELARLVLSSLARRFENEALAAERAKEEANG